MVQVQRLAFFRSKDGPSIVREEGSVYGSRCWWVGRSGSGRLSSSFLSAFVFSVR